MKLSFREHAAIALYSVPASEYQKEFTSETAVKYAQVLADAACEGWGHDESMYPSSDNTRLCLRCGKKVKKEE